MYPVLGLVRGPEKFFPMTARFFASSWGFPLLGFQLPGPADILTSDDQTKMLRGYHVEVDRPIFYVGLGTASRIVRR